MTTISGSRDPGGFRDLPGESRLGTLIIATPQELWKTPRVLFVVLLIYGFGVRLSQDTGNGTQVHPPLGAWTLVRFIRHAHEILQVVEQDFLTL